MMLVRALGSTTFDFDDLIQRATKQFDNSVILKENSFVVSAFDELAASSPIGRSMLIASTDFYK